MIIMRTFALIMGPNHILAGPIYTDQRGRWRFLFTNQLIYDVANPWDAVTIFSC